MKKLGTATTEGIRRNIMEDTPVVGIIMGSESDWPTMKYTATVLDELSISHEARIISAHRTPDRMHKYTATAKSRGIKIIIAGAGKAAALPGAVAALTPLPVLGVPMKTSDLGGQDSLLSMVQMPAGIPVGTLAIGNAGATNAGLLAASILALNDGKIAKALKIWRENQSQNVPQTP